MVVVAFSAAVVDEADLWVADLPVADLLVADLTGVHHREAVSAESKDIRDIPA